MNSAIRPPALSVIIPTYNRPGYLKHCLRCLYIQASDAHPFEVIVVTDGPDEASANATKAFINIPYMPVRLLSLPEKRGPAAARNMGWKAATGSLIIFTDDDCLPAAGFVTAYANAFTRCNADLAAFSGRVLVPVAPVPTDYEQNTAQLSHAEFVTANCACSKKALQVVEGFDEAFTMAWREDSDLQFSLLDHRIPIRNVDEALVVHPVRTAAWGVSLKEQKKSMFNALLYKKHRQLFREKIYSRPLAGYYAMNIALLSAVIFSLLRWPLAAAAGILVWAIMVIWFAGKRLRHTSKRPEHIMEMLFTSALIPFLSVYWTLYGSWRFKSFLL